MRCGRCGIDWEPGESSCSQCRDSAPISHGAGSREVVWPEGLARPLIRRRSADTDDVDVALEMHGNLIRFPHSRSPLSPEVPSVSAPASSVGSAAVPEWRQLIRERVRESRERRGTNQELPKDVGPDDSSTSSTPASADRNPIVESALSRLRNAGQPVTPLPVSHRGSTSSARALKPSLIEDPASQTEAPRPVDPPLLKKTTTENTRSRRPLGGTEAPAAPTDGVSRSGPQRERIRTRGIVIRPTPPGPSPVSPPAIPALEAEPTSAPEKTERSNPDVNSKGPSPATSSKVQPVQTSGDPSQVARSRDGAVEPSPSRSPRVTRRLKSPPKQIDTQVIGVPQVLESALSRRGEPASFWVRTLAGGYDFEITALSFLPVFAAYAGLNTVLEIETLLVMLVLFSLLSFFYHGVTMSLAGRTYGMAMLNLRLISLEGEADEVSRKQRLLRAWAATIASLLPPLNLLVRISNRRRLSLPDLISGTLPVED